MGITLGRDNVCYIHLTLVPYIAAAGEMKTKPTQHSVKELREIGIQPDVVLCRADRPLLDGDRRKIALFTNVPPEAVIPALDADSIYKIPGALHAEGLDAIVCKKLQHRSAAGGPRRRGTGSSTRSSIPEHAVHIAMVGKYVDLTESYKSLSEALTHAGIHTRSKVQHPLRRFRGGRARRHRLPVRRWTRSSCPAASASAASKARSRRSATRARTASRISASVSACSSP